MHCVVHVIADISMWRRHSSNWVKPIPMTIHWTFLIILYFSHAAMNNRLDIVQFLFKNRYVDVNETKSRNNSKCTALMCAARVDHTSLTQSYGTYWTNRWSLLISSSLKSDSLNEWRDGKMFRFSLSHPPSMNSRQSLKCDPIRSTPPCFSFTSTSWVWSISWTIERTTSRRRSAWALVDQPREETHS